jgi:hypothetical protein
MEDIFIFHYVEMIGKLIVNHPEFILVPLMNPPLLIQEGKHLLFSINYFFN